MTLKRIISILLAFTAIISFLPIYICSESGEAGIHLSASLSDNAQYIEFKLSCTQDFKDELYTLYGTNKVELFGLLPYQSTDNLSDMNPLLEDIKLDNEKTVRLSLGSDNIHRGYILCVKKEETVILPPAQSPDDVVDTSPVESDAETNDRVTENIITYIPLTEKIYVEGIYKRAENKQDFPNFTSKKGLNISLFTDAQLLGTSHTVINIYLNEYVSSKETDIYEEIDGQRVYFNKNSIALLDHTVKIYSDAGINVIFNYALSQPTGTESGSMLSLYPQGRSNSAIGYSMNCDTKDSYIILSACAKLFSARYSIDSDFGFVGSYIIGYEINSQNTYYSDLHSDIDKFVSSYADVVRIFANYAYSEFENSKIYISLNNKFNVSDPDGNFSGREIIEKFNALLNEQGNFGWNVCINPYNENISSPLFTSEASSVNTIDTPYITMNNIGVLTSMLSEPKYYYLGKSRSVLLGEVAYTSGSGTESEQTLQAASYAYAYFKAECDPLIDAIIYNRHVDSELEQNKFGLYFNISGSSSPSVAKKIYEVFKYIDTDKAEEICEFALPVFGADGWGELIYGCSVSKLGKRKIIDKTSMDASDVNKNITYESIYNYEVNSFYPSDNAHSVEYTDNGILISTYKCDSTEYRGVYHSLTDIDNAVYLHLNISAQSEQYSGISNVMVRITGTDDDGMTVIYEGTAQINANTPTELYFDISEFSHDCVVSNIKVWSKPFTSNTADDYSIVISSLDICKKKSIINAFTITLTVILVALFCCACVFLVKFFKSSKGKKPIK